MKVKELCMIGVIGVVIMIMFASMPVKAANVSITNTPTSASPGEGITFRLTVSNDGSDYVRIEAVMVHFAWQYEGDIYILSDTQTIIASGDTFTYEANILIPTGIASNINYDMKAKVAVADPDGSGGWHPVVEYPFSGSFYMSEPDLNDDDDSETPGFDLPVIAVAGFVSIGIFAIVRKRR